MNPNFVEAIKFAVFIVSTIAGVLLFINAKWREMEKALSRVEGEINLLKLHIGTLGKNACNSPCDRVRTLESKVVKLDKDSALADQRLIEMLTAMKNDMLTEFIKVVRDEIKYVEEAKRRA